MAPLRAARFLLVCAVFCSNSRGNAQPTEGGAASAEVGGGAASAEGGAEDTQGEGASEERPSAEPSEPEPDKRARAKAAFKAGLAELQQHQYADAKRHFLEAHALSPHPIVAYNAALACIALGHVQEAIALLDEALQVDQDRLSPQERETITAARVELEAQESVPAPPVSPPQPAAAGGDATPPRAERGDDPADPVAEPPAPARAQTVAPTAPPAVPVEAGREASGWSAGHWILGSGLTLLVASGALYVWNDQRHAEWERENAALYELQDELLARSESPSDDPELRGRVADNDSLLRSIQTLDAVDAALLAGGLLGVGVGGYLVLDGDEVEAQVSLGGRVSVRVSF